MTSCEYCIDLGSQIARRRSGITDEQLLALPRYRESELFTDLEKLVLDYAVAISRTPTCPTSCSPSCRSTSTNSSWWS